MLERGAIDATEWGTLYENISMGFHKIAKYVIIPGVHQPSAPFELCINKDAWSKLSDRDKALVELAAKQVTLESWMRVGDAKALKFFKEQGNEIIELSPEVQRATKEMSVKWADEQAKSNPWFKKVWESQRAFEKLWGNASSYRNACYSLLWRFIPRTSYIFLSVFGATLVGPEPHHPRPMSASAASMSSLVSTQSLSRLATTFFMKWPESRLARSLSPR